MAQILGTPPFVPQVAATCWAAALQSWCAVTPQVPNWSFDDIFSTAVSMGKVYPNSGALIMPPGGFFTNFQAVLNSPTLGLMMQQGVFDSFSAVSDAFGTIVVDIANGYYVYLFIGRTTMFGMQ
jgi:hypothetical protein